MKKLYLIGFFAFFILVGETCIAQNSDVSSAKKGQMALQHAINNYGFPNKQSFSDPSDYKTAKKAWVEANPELHKQMKGDQPAYLAPNPTPVNSRKRTMIVPSNLKK
jgi:hypothetical protein